MEKIKYNSVELKTLEIKSTALILLLGKLAKVPPENEAEEVSRDDIIVKLTYWIGAAQLHLDGEAEAANLDLSQKEVEDAIDSILSLFMSAPQPKE